jgi:hypothetical protein
MQTSAAPNNLIFVPKYGGDKNSTHFRPISFLQPELLRSTIDGNPLGKRKRIARNIANGAF